jgi:hypothetical protein
MNDGSGKFTLKSLPTCAQVSPVFGIDARDLDGDGKLDLLLGGNLYGVKPEAGRYDASFGTVLQGDGKGGFSEMSPAKSGLKVDGEIREIITLKGRENDIIVIGRNNASVITLKHRTP